MPLSTEPYTDPVDLALDVLQMMPEDATRMVQDDLNLVGLALRTAVEMSDIARNQMDAVIKAARAGERDPFEAEAEVNALAKRTQRCVTASEMLEPYVRPVGERK